MTIVIKISADKAKQDIAYLTSLVSSMPGVSRSTLKRLDDNISSAVRKGQKKLGLNILSRLRTETPIDTGHARASWTPTINTPSKKVLLKTFITLRVIKLVENKRLLPFFITSNAAYIRDLNYRGTSKQANRLFVQRIAAQEVSRL